MITCIPTGVTHGTIGIALLGLEVVMVMMVRNRPSGHPIPRPSRQTANVAASAASVHRHAAKRVEGVPVATTIAEEVSVGRP